MPALPKVKAKKLLYDVEFKVEIPVASRSILLKNMIEGNKFNIYILIQEELPLLLIGYRDLKGFFLHG